MFRRLAPLALVLLAAPPVAAKDVPNQAVLDKLRILANVPKLGPVDMGTLADITKNLATQDKDAACTPTTRPGLAIFDVECSVNFRTYSFTLKGNGFGNLVLSDLERDAKPLNLAQKVDAFRDVFDIDPNAP